MDSEEGKRANSFLAGGYYACLLQLIGDLDYNSKWLGLARWSNHTTPCCLCQAQFRGALSWLDNRPNAKWISSCFTHANWKQFCKSICALFDLPGFSTNCVAVDYTHNMFLGWLQYLYGTIFHMLVYVVMDAEPLKNLAEISSYIVDFQKRSGTKYKYRQPLNKISMFQKKQDIQSSRAGLWTSWA